MKNICIVTTLSMALFLTAGVFNAYTAAEEDFTTFEEKAHRSHELSMSDVMYQQEDFRALYYQNETMIQLLKEIRDEMHEENMRDAKEKK